MPSDSGHAITFADAELPANAAIAEALVQAGAETVFGLSGGLTSRVYDALSARTADIRTVLVRNEAQATCAAEAYARLSGRVGVAMGQGSWLAGQAAVGTLEAFLGCTPMLLIADFSDGAPYSHHGPYQSATAEYGSWDVAGTFRGMTKAVFEARDPVQAVQAIQHGLKHAISGQPGPVAVLLHSLALAGSVGPDSRPLLYRSEHYVRPHAASAAPDVSVVTGALRTAGRPVIVAGGGVRTARAQTELRRLAEATGARVVTTSSGKGVIGENADVSAGTFGPYAMPGANDELAAADVVLVIGSKLGPSDTINENPALLDPARQHIIQLDIEPKNAGWTYPAWDVITADAKIALAAMLTELERQPVAASVLALRRQQALQPQWPSPETEPDGTPVHPRRVIAEMRDALPDDVVVCLDAGENRLLMCRYFQTRKGGEYLQPAAAGGMGYAMPAAIGAKVADPSRTVVAVCGDGGFSMSLPTLLTVVEQNLDITVILFDNGALGWVMHGQRERGLAPFNSELLRFDYVKIAEAAGMWAARAEKPANIGPAVHAALGYRGPSLVSINVSREETWVDLRSPLAR
jgi:acetolactate synthase-1/2/3 large subunit